MAKAVGWPVEVHAYADRIVVRCAGEVVAEHARCFGRGREAAACSEHPCRDSASGNPWAGRVTPGECRSCC